VKDNVLRSTPSLIALIFSIASIEVSPVIDLELNADEISGHRSCRSSSSFALGVVPSGGKPADPGGYLHACFMLNVKVAGAAGRRASA